MKKKNETILLSSTDSNPLCPVNLWLMYIIIISHEDVPPEYAIKEVVIENYN